MFRRSLVAAALSAFALTIHAQPPGGRAVHVTLHEGTSMAAALSPDGRTIAIDLLGTLWTMPAGGGVASSDLRNDRCRGAATGRAGPVVACTDRHSDRGRARHGCRAGLGRTPRVRVSAARPATRPSLTVVARSTGDAIVAVRALREALRRVDPDLAVDVSGTGRAIFAGPWEFVRAAGMAALALGALTLLLAMVGLFGIQSHMVAHRTPEIGVRMSFGASAAQIERRC